MIKKVLTNPLLKLFFNSTVYNTVVYTVVIYIQYSIVNKDVLNFDLPSITLKKCGSLVTHFAI